MIRIQVNGVVVETQEGLSLAAAMLSAGVGVFRRSVSGEARGPVCGMGVCFECRVRIDGAAHVRSCLVTAREGMVIDT